MRVVIRTDGSREIGSGHVARCLTLADRLRADGAEVTFVSREHVESYCGLIVARGYPVKRLPLRDARSEGTLRHADWLGATMDADAAETLAALREGGPVDWLVVDHYGIDARWESALRPAARRIMVIDDLADREHDCDVLLDQNLIADFETRYDGLALAGTKMLLGPRYALVQPEYAGLRPERRPHGGPVRRVFAYFGGGNNGRLERAMVEAFVALRRNDVSLDLVSGGDRDALQALAGDAANIAIHPPQKSLAPLMAEADLAVGGSGATNWERLCLGLPAIVVTMAENQRAIAEELHRRRLARWIGDAADVNADRLRAELAACLDDGAAWFDAELADVVDGRGAGRIVHALRAAAAMAAVAAVI